MKGHVRCCMLRFFTVSYMTPPGILDVLFPGLYPTKNRESFTNYRELKRPHFINEKND